MTPRTLAASLSKYFGERFLTPGDRRYDSARKVWNGMVDKRPLGLVKCADGRDVSIALTESVAAGVPISILAGGHQIAGGAVIEDGVVLDLSAMRSVNVDRQSSNVSVGGGALLGDLDRAASRYGLAVPAGVVSHTGVGGLTLGGGIGWLSRSRGLTCDRLLSARVIDGTGRERLASSTENPDLFWAMRGGGGNFGVVTEFTYEAAPIGWVTFGTRTVNLQQARAALIEYGSRADTLPRQLQVMVKVQKALSQSGPNHRRGEPVVTFEWMWSGDPVDAFSAQESLGLEHLGSAQVARQRFAEVQSHQDHRYPHGFRYFLKPGHFNALTAEVADAMLKAAESMPSEDAQIEVLLLGGTIDDVPESETAYPKRSARFAYNVTAGWESDLLDQEHIGWCRSTHQSLNRLATEGAYINFLGADEVVDLSSIFGAAKYARLREVKAQYDPGQIFQPMVPIPPADSPLAATNSGTR